MKEPTDLELYLRNQESEGTSVSEGAFTISRDEALAKLSSFQLPFEGAWVVKLVQAGVVHEGMTSLFFTQSNKETSFWCKGRCSWTLDAIETALLDPNYSEDRGLLHLVTALRVVGFGQKRAFWIEEQGQREKIVWDGQKLSRVTSERASASFEVMVSNKALGDEGGFFGLAGRKLCSERNAAASQSLYQICHTCPKPLSLDGARIEGLEMNPNHGWGAQSQLIAMGFGDGRLPQLGVPPRTVSRTVVSQVTVEDKLAEVTKEQRHVGEERRSYGIAYLVSAHLARVKSGKSYVWREREGQSLLYWVQDGVVIRSEQFDISPDFCSVGCFVSADGLETDLSGFSLRESPEKQARIQEARRLLRENLAEVHTIDLEQMARNAENAAKGVGALFTAIGIGSFFFSPAHGFIFAGVGLYSYFAAGSAGKDRSEKMSKSLSRLCREI